MIKLNHNSKNWTLLLLAMVWLIPQVAAAQGVQCDPEKVVTAAQCAKCHNSEVSVWKTTPHFQTYEQLSRNPKAKQICQNLGLRSVKRSDVCIDCHFTKQSIDGNVKPVSGISCESCHGAAEDWISVHSDFGGPTTTKDMETPEHAVERYQTSMELGMRNTRDLYLIASSCFNCHTVPNENLVNTGGHVAGTSDFELVSWSQGKVRHNFLRSDGATNAPASAARLRVMFVVGMIADLEYSTRATAKATSHSTYGVTVAQRAASVAQRLFELQQKINDPHVQQVLEAFAQVELRTNNEAALTATADQIQAAGRRFAAANDGSQLAAIDALLPPPEQYR